MPKIAVTKMEARREAIVAAAEQVFVENGLAQTSIAAIAREAGISDGLLYRYFDGKIDLLTEVLERFYGKMIARTQNLVQAETQLEQQMTALVHSHLLAFCENPGLCLLFIREVRALEAYAGSRIEQFNRQYTAILVRVLQAAAERGEIASDIDARLVRDMVFGGVEHIAWRQIARKGPVDIDGTTNTIVRVLIRGLRGGE